MALLSRVKTWVAEILTPSDLNAEFDNILNGLTPANIEDISANVSAMQTVVDPGEVGTESLASNVTGELQRLRNMIKEITGKTQWYETPDRSLDSSEQYNSLTSSDADPDVDDIDILIVDTSGGTVTLGGLQNGITDQILFVYKTDTGNALTISDNGAGTQKIRTHTGSDVLLTAATRGGIVMIFDGTIWVTLEIPINDDEIVTSMINNLAVTTAKIDDLAVTNGKIALNAITSDKISNGEVTRIDQEAVGEQVSADAGNFFTGSTTFVDVTNLEVTITAARAVVVALVPDDSSGLVSQLESTFTSGVQHQVQLLRASSVVLLVNLDAGKAEQFPVSAIWHLDTTGSGARTYKIQCKTDNVADLVAVRNCKLIAYEL